MICHNCKKDIDLVAQVKEIDDMYWKEITGPAMVMLDCSNCKEQIAMLEVSPMREDEFEEVESPALGGTVKVPKPKRINLEDLK